MRYPQMTQRVDSSKLNLTLTIQSFRGDGSGELDDVHVTIDEEEALGIFGMLLRYLCPERDELLCWLQAASDINDHRNQTLPTEDLTI